MKNEESKNSMARRRFVASGLLASLGILTGCDLEEEKDNLPTTKSENAGKEKKAYLELTAPLFECISVADKSTDPIRHYQIKGVPTGTSTFHAMGEAFAGYKREICRVHKLDLKGTIPIKERVIQTKDGERLYHYCSDNSVNADETKVIGYTFSEQINGTLPLRVFSRPDIDSEILVLDGPEVTPLIRRGYKDKGKVGFAFPPKNN